MAKTIHFGLSLDLIQLDHQEPNRNRRESKYFWDELFTLIPAAGFRGIELPYQPKWDFGGRSGIPLSQYAIRTKYGSVARFKAMLESNGIEKIAGIYFNPSLFISENQDAYFGAFGHFAGQAVEFCAEAEAGVLTLTPTPFGGLVRHYLGQNTDWSMVKTDFLKRTADLINRLAEQAADSGVVIAIKREYWSLLRETGFDDFLKHLDPRIRLNIDTAHAQIAGNDPVRQITAAAERIGSIHFTDTAFVDETRVWQGKNPEFPTLAATQIFRDLGQGNVDLAAAYQALQDLDYDGWVICSCRQTRDAMRAMLRTRRVVDRIRKGEKGGALA
ncbi:MAG: sugar phosphate isomerase/epimerase [Clostridiaceae bacterium]|nr:sugar phosphate isomerase/epimerase [Clostridiaceae bacterium]